MADPNALDMGQAHAGQMSPVDPTAASTMPVDTTMSPIDFGQTDGESTPLSAETASNRAWKARKGMPGYSKDFATIQSEMANGFEQEQRNLMASEFNMKKQMAGLELIRNLSKELGRPLTPEESRKAMYRIEQMSRPEDPRTIVETMYTQEMLDSLDRAIDGKPESPAAELKRDDPEAYSLIKTKGTEFKAWQEIVHTFEENNREVLKNQSYIGFGLDLAKNISQVYQEVKLRGQTGTYGGLTLAENLRRQADDLMNITDLSKRTALLKSIMDGLNRDNPQLGQKFLEYVKGQSYSESTWDMIGTPLVFTGASTAIAGRGAFKGAKALYNFKETSRMVKDTLRGVPSDINEHKFEEALGKLSDAAVRELEARIITKMAGASKEEVEAVQNLFRLQDLNRAATRGETVEGVPGKQLKHEFTTAKGSHYTVMEDGTTVRNKAARPEHTNADGSLDQGLKPRSEKTIYVSGTDANNMARRIGGGKWDIIDNGDGTITMKVLDRGQWGTPAELKNIKTYEQPVVGLSPVEFWNNGSRVHVGNRIRNVEKEAVEIRPAAPVKPDDLRRGLANALDELSMSTQVNIWTALSNQLKVNRLPSLSENMTEVLKGLLDYHNTLYPHLVDRLLNISEPVRNARFINLYDYHYYYGAKGKEVYPNAEKAQVAANMSSLPDNVYEIVPHGTGYAIKIKKTLKEDEPFLRNTLIKTKESKSPETFMNTFLGWANAKTPEETLSFDHRLQRKTATYAPSNYLAVVKEMAAPIQELASFKNRKAFKDWESIVKLSRTEPDPKTNLQGYFFATPNELTQKYLQLIHRAPSELEIKAYYAYRDVMDFDYVLRNFNLYEGKARLGVEQHQITLFAKDTLEKKTSGWFEGVRSAALPRTEDHIIVMGKHPGEEKLIRGGGAHMDEKTRTYYDERIKKGELHVIKIDPHQDPLKDFIPGLGSDKPVYIITHTSETKALTLNQIPRRGGGHWEYDYDYYIKQAKVRPETLTNKIFRHIYEGDTTIMPIMLRSMGVKVAKDLDEFRLALKASNDALALTISNRLDIDFKELRSWFINDKNPKAATRLNLDEPIQVVDKDKFIIDHDRKGLESRYVSLKDESKAANFGVQTEFTGKRDAYEIFTLRDIGTRHQPLWAHEPAQFIDPLPSINRAMSRIIKSSFLDDYKTYAIEHWLQEAKGALRNSASEIAYAPLHVYHNPDYANVDADVLARIKTRKHQIDQFLGAKNEVDSLLSRGIEKLQESVYERFGPGAMKYVPDEFLHKMTDGSAFLRSITFHAKLGLFNIPQILIQAQGFANILAVAGMKHATGGAYSMLLTQWARANSNPNVIAKLDEMMTKMRMPGSSWWKTGEFKESLEGLKASGFMNVGGEYALRDTALSPNLFRSKAGAVLDAGTWFFTEGERSVRIGAWHTAYREFRDANPAMKLGQNEWQKIQERADILSNNMSRASQSGLHTGWMQFPAQFLAYQIRMAELFWGKRLGETLTERNLARARMVFWYGMLYGAPVGAAVGGLPLVESIRQAALERGYIVGEKWYQDLAMNGLPSYLIQLATGKSYSLQSAYGPQGITPLKDLFTGDKPAWELMGGASASLLKDTWEGLSGFHAAMMSGIRDDGHYYPIKVDDYLSVARGIATVEKVNRWYLAHNYGKWITKKGIELDNVKPMEAFLMSISGTQHTEAVDAHLLAESLKDKKKNDKKAEDLFGVEFRKGLRAARDNNPDQADAYFKRAFTILHVMDYPDWNFKEAVHKATTGEETLINRIDWEFYAKRAPKYKGKEYIERYQTKQNIMEERNK